MSGYVIDKKFQKFAGLLILAQCRICGYAGCKSIKKGSDPCYLSNQLEDFLDSVFVRVLFLDLNP